MLLLLLLLLLPLQYQIFSTLRTPPAVDWGRLLDCPGESGFQTFLFEHLNRRSLHFPKLALVKLRA